MMLKMFTIDLLFIAVFYKFSFLIVENLMGTNSLSIKYSYKRQINKFNRKSLFIFV
jgi:hypothetical protein